MPRGIIVNIISNIYNVENVENNKIYKCSVRGKFKNDDVTPVVGDNVDFQIINEQKFEAVIEDVIDRINYVKRPKMANLTQIIFTLSTKMPKPDLLLLDKQLAFAEHLGIKPIICINKIDLGKQEEIDKIQKTYMNIGYTVIQTQGNSGEGVQELIKLLKGNITAFSGNSGVGKSTLINHIFEKNITQEGLISERIQRGKNTTTIISLYKIDDDTYIADTPGFSTFDVFEIESEDLYKNFIEFNKYVKNCEYTGCSHIKEGNCGIKQAVEQGQIDNGRYERYCKIYLELKEKEKHKW